MATTNRKKEYDLSFVKCDQEYCHDQTFNQIWQRFVDEGFKCKHIHVGNEITARDIFYSSSKSVLVVLLACRHSQKVQNDFARQYIRGAHISFLVGLLDTVRYSLLKKDAKFIRNERELKNFVTRIKETLEQNVEYTDIGAVNVVDESTDHVYETIAGARYLIDQEKEYVDDTPVKYVIPEERNPCVTLGECVDVFHRATTETKEDYVDARSLRRENVPFGSFVKESYTSPSQNFHCPASEIPHLYIQGSDGVRENLAKHIVAERGPALFKNRELFDLVVLTKCQNRSIQTKLFELIEELVYTREVCKCNIEEIIRSVHELTQLLPHGIGDHVLVLKMIHVITASLGILYLWTLERGCDSHLENSIDDICRKVRDCPPMDNIGAHGDCLKYSIKSMHSLAQSLRAKLTNLSTLKIGHWRDALPIKETRAKIEEDLKNFSEIENYACVLGISNQILQVTNARNIDFLKFLHRVVETMTKIWSKKKDYTMFHVCITLTKVVTFVASKPELSESGTDGSSDCEYKGTLLMILSLVLEGKFLSQIQRLHLIDIVKPLLFHKDKVIIHQIIGILGKNSFKASDFRRMVLPHIESTLLALNVKLDHKDYDIEEINGPVWRALSGRIGYDCKVRVQVLFPTFHSISKGSMYNYSEYADENETKYHTTNLETLHSLNSVSHHNICRLIAYQTRPLPYFYITESFQEHDLSKYLLRMRRNQTWLPEDTLVIMTTGLMEAVMYLHSKKIIHRDLTTRSFALKDGDTPVLRDFGIALSDKDGFAIDTTENLIPLRWSPAVSILEDRFDVNTDKYMVGMMIYELFTHGCQPFTELYNMELGKILEMVIFQDLKPRHTPCIPRPIHDLLLKFVSFDGSYTLQDGLQTLEQYLSRSKDRRLRPSDSHGGDWKYPELSKSQEEPERELPEFIKSFKVSGTNPRQMYFNLRASQRKQTAHLACTEADLLSSEDPEIKINSTVVTVVEPVENSFLEEVLPRIIWTELTIHEKPQIERKPNEKQNLIYRLDGVNIIDLALRNTYGDPYDDEPAQRYLQVVIKLVDFVQKMHSSNFVLRDICGKVMYLTKDGNGKVATTRIGRMMYLNPESIDDCLADRQFTERWNWLPIELIDNSQYSFESDIYMLAMTIHEYYSALDLYRDNPSANRLKCIPFPMVPRDKLRDHLLCGEIPEQSNACSPLLYDILKTCWNRDRTQRPSAASLKTSLINLVDREGARSSQIMEENPDYQFDPPSPCSSTESSMAASFNKYLELKPDDSKNAIVDEDVDDVTKSFRSSLFKRTIKPHIQTNIVRSDQSVKFNPCFDERESLKRDDSQKNVRRSALLNNSVKTSHSRSQSEIDDTNHHFNRTRTERVTFRTNKLVKRLSESSTLKREKLPLDNSQISEICVAPPKLIVREISVDSAGAETDGSSISFANSSSGNTSSGSVLTIANPSSADNTDNNDTDVHSEHELSYISSANYSKVSKDKNPNDDGKVDVQESIYELEDCEQYESLADDKPCSDDNPYLDVVFHHSNQPYHQESTTNADEVSLQDKNDSPESEVKTRHSIDVEIHHNKTDFKDDAVGYQDFDPFYLQQI